MRQAASELWGRQRGSGTIVSRVPHFCADCQHEYDESIFQQTPPEQRRCPHCGSTRIDARPRVHAVGAITAVGSVKLMLMTSLWLTWIRIAIDRAKGARQHRDAAIQPDASNRGDHLRGEFEAAMVAVAGSAHSLDALYGSSVIPQYVRTQWRKQDGPPREAKIREALKVTFDTGPVNGSWVSEFRWLFDLRDAAAHASGVARQELRRPEPHPIGTNTSAAVAAYTVEAAERAVGFALSVFRWCVDHPRSNLPDAVKWASDHEAAVARLEAKWRAH